MQSRCSSFLMMIALFVSCQAWGQSIQSSGSQSAPAPQSAPVQTSPHNGGDFSTVTKPDPNKVVPKDTLIVKGAWYSASDSTTPAPEGASVANSMFSSPYFGITYPLPDKWYQKYYGPPPSETGFYTLAELVPVDATANSVRGHMEIFAQDMFFSPLPAKNALQMIRDSSSHLMDPYKVEMKPTELKVAGQSFSFFAYTAPVSGLHWYTLATEIRCHTVKIVMTSRDTKLLESLILDLNKMKLPADASPTGGTGGGNVPVCIKDYASGDNVVERVDPVFPMRRYNAVPVRIIIDAEGKVKYIHVISAFPEQEKAIMDALKQWRFRPYERDGQRLEVETGIMFGRPVQKAGADEARTATSD
jgi:hypothetical protein